jgi:hypothetical protein
MYERGYFRDPYNDHDLLWKFNLSWWDDVVPMLNARSELTIAQASLDVNQNVYTKSPVGRRKEFVDQLERSLVM